MRQGRSAGEAHRQPQEPPIVPLHALDRVLVPLNAACILSELHLPPPALLRSCRAWPRRSDVQSAARGRTSLEFQARSSWEKKAGKLAGPSSPLIWATRQPRSALVGWKHGRHHARRLPAGPGSAPGLLRHPVPPARGAARAAGGSGPCGRRCVRQEAMEALQRPHGAAPPEHSRCSWRCSLGLGLWRLIEYCVDEQDVGRVPQAGGSGAAGPAASWPLPGAARGPPDAGTLFPAPAPQLPRFRAWGRTSGTPATTPRARTPPPTTSSGSSSTRRARRWAGSPTWRPTTSAASRTPPTRPAWTWART